MTRDMGQEGAWNAKRKVVWVREKEQGWELRKEKQREKKRLQEVL